MAKKKIKKKAKKVVRAKSKVKKTVRARKPRGEKILGKVDHFFGHIAVAAIKVKSPIKVGDLLHFKGHTTDFVQMVDSMQIEHQNVPRARAGDDIGIKVKDKVRQGDTVYLSSEKPPAATLSAKPFINLQSLRPPISKTFQPPLSLNKPAQPKPPATPKPEAKPADPYSNVKFLGF